MEILGQSEYLTANQPLVSGEATQVEDKVIKVVNYDHIGRCIESTYQFIPTCNLERVALPVRPEQ